MAHVPRGVGQHGRGTPEPCRLLPLALGQASRADSVLLDVQVKKGTKTTASKAKRSQKFTIDCSQPVDDGIMDAAGFVRARGGDGGYRAGTLGGLTRSMPPRAGEIPAGKDQGERQDGEPG